MEELIWNWDDSQQIEQTLQIFRGIIFESSGPEDSKLDIIRNNNFEFVDKAVTLLAELNEIGGFEITRNLKGTVISTLIAAGFHFSNEIYSRIAELGAFRLWIFKDLQNKEDTELIFFALCMIASICQQTVPSHEKTKLSPKLCKLLMDMVFQYENDESNEQIHTSVVKALVAVSSQFSSPQDNKVLDQLKLHERAFEMGQKFIIILNRGSEDLKSVECCLNLLQHIFLDSQTAQQLLYANDLNVLIDVIIREVDNLGSGEQSDKLRYMFLETLLLLLTNSQYQQLETKYRAKDIVSLLEGFTNSEDRQIARFANQILVDCKAILE